MRRTLTSFAFGALLGSALTFVLVKRRDVAKNRDTFSTIQKKIRIPARISAPAEISPVAQKLQIDGGTLSISENQIRQLQQQLAMERELNNESRGAAPLQKPEGLPAKFLDAQLIAKSILAQQQKVLGREELTDVACDEYPCSVIISGRSGGIDAIQKIVSQPLLPPLQDSHLYIAKMEWNTDSTDGHFRIVAVVALNAEPESRVKAAAERLRARYDAAERELQHLFKEEE